MASFVKISFATQLSGDKAFYNQADYFAKTQKDLASSETLSPDYAWNTESKTWRIAKHILAIIFFPIAIYNLLHFILGKLVFLPASQGKNAQKAQAVRQDILKDANWKYKRFSIEVDGEKIDAMILGRESTLHNGRWMLVANGNGGLYERAIAHGKELKPILSEIHANGIVFNYPGVGASSGLPNCKTMEKAYRAMLRFLEDAQKGIGAKEIIGWSYSIGGGVQGQALESHALQEGIKYAFVKNRTFSDLSSAASGVMGETSCLGRVAKVATKAFGWNLNSVVSSKRLKVPEIIIQTADVQKNTVLHDSSKIINDGIITAEASLAKRLLDDAIRGQNKKFIGVKEPHDKHLSDLSFFAEQINAALVP
jgi:hypothetical protein